MGKHKDKPFDEAVLDVLAAPAFTGPVNWPQFNPEQRIYSARSFAHGSFPASCGPLQACKAALLPAFTPRNHYFTSPQELELTIQGDQYMSEQVKWLQSYYPESFLPRKLAVSLLRQDIWANLEVNPQGPALSNTCLAAAAMCGYPSYDLLAEQLRGNRLAAVPLPGGVTAVFSATGQIGEVLTLTLMKFSKADADSSASGGDGSSGAGDGVAAAASAVPPQPPPADSAATAGSRGDRLQALPAAHLSLNKTIWEIVAKEHRTSRPPAVNAVGRGGAATGTAAAAAHASGSPSPGVLRAGSWNLADMPFTPSVPSGSAMAGQPGSAAAASPSVSTPAVWVAVRCNYAINVLLAYQVDPSDWHSWRLEWRASHATQRLTAALTWNPHLPELAFMLADGSVWIAGTHAAAGGAAAALRRLAVRPVLKPMPPAVRHGRNRIVPPPVAHNCAGAHVALLPGEGRLCVAYGAHPRTLLVARGRCFLRVDLRPVGQRHECSLLHYLGTTEGTFYGLATGASLSGMQLAASPQLLLHLAVLVTGRLVMLMDTRRGQHGPVQLACAHGLPKGQMPTMVSFWAGPWQNAPAEAPVAASGSEDIDVDGAGDNGTTTGPAAPAAFRGGKSRPTHQPAQEQPTPQQPLQRLYKQDQQQWSQRPLPSIVRGRQSFVNPFDVMVDEPPDPGFFRGDRRRIEPLSGLYAPRSKQTCGADSTTVPATVSPARGSLHVVLLLANERTGDVQCMEVVLEDASLGMQVEFPPQPNGRLTQKEVQRARLPYIALVAPPENEYTVPGVAPPSRGNGGGGSGGGGRDRGSGGAAAADPGPSGACLAGRASSEAATAPPHDSAGIARSRLHAAPAEDQLRSLADAVWRPACIAHLHLLGLPYPPCKTVRDEIGSKLMLALLGARSQAYGTVGVGDPKAGQYGRSSVLVKEFVQAGRSCCDLAGCVALLPSPCSSSSSSSSTQLTPSSLASGQCPLLLLRLSYDGDLLLQPLRRLPVCSVLQTRSETRPAAAGQDSVGIGVASDARRTPGEDVPVEVLDSHFFAPDFAARLEPATYQPLLRAYRDAVDASLAAGHLRTAGSSAALTRLDVTAQRRMSSFALRLHYVHMANMLRWAAASGCHAAAAAGADAQAGGRGEFLGAGRVERAGGGREARDREGSAMARRLKRPRESGGAQRTAAAGSDGVDGGNGGGGEWPHEEPQWDALLCRLPQLRFADDRVQSPTATRGGGGGEGEGGEGEDEGGTDRGGEGGGGAAAGGGVGGVSQGPSMATQKARALRRAPLKRIKRNGLVHKFDRLGVAVVYPVKPTVMPRSIWSLYRASEVPPVGLEPPQKGRADSDAGPSGPSAQDEQVKARKRQHRNDDMDEREEKQFEISKSAAAEAGCSTVGPTAMDLDENGSAGAAAAPAPAATAAAAVAAAAAGLGETMRRAEDREGGGHHGSDPPAAVSHAAHIVRDAVQQRLLAAQHPTFVSELSQTVCDAVELNQYRLDNINNGWSRTENHTFQIALAHVRGATVGRLLDAALATHRATLGLRKASKAVAVSAANEALAAAHAAEEVSQRGLVEEPGVPAQALVAAAAAAVYSAAASTRAAAEAKKGAQGMPAPSIWELEYQEMALMALHTGRLASAAPADSVTGGGIQGPPGASSSAGQLAPLALRSLGHTIPATAAKLLNANADVLLSIQPSAMPRGPSSILRLRAVGGPVDSRGAATARPVTADAARRDGVGARVDDLMYLRSLVTYRPSQLQPGVSVMVPEPCYGPYRERSVEHFLADLVRPPPPGRNKFRRAADMMGRLRKEYQRMARRRHRLLPSTAAPPPAPGSVAPVLTPVGAVMLESLMEHWPEYKAKATGTAGAAAGADQPRVLHAPCHLAQWASQLRPWPSEQAGVEQVHQGDYTPGKKRRLAWTRFYHKKRGKRSRRDGEDTGRRPAAQEPEAPEDGLGTPDIGGGLPTAGAGAAPGSEVAGGAAADPEGAPAPAKEVVALGAAVPSSPLPSQFAPAPESASSLLQRAAGAANGGFRASERTTTRQPSSGPSSSQAPSQLPLSQQPSPLPLSQPSSHAGSQKLKLRRHVATAGRRAAPPATHVEGF